MPTDLMMLSHDLHKRHHGDSMVQALTTVDGKAPPSTAVASLKQISAAFLFLGLYVTLSARFTLDRILAPSFSDLPYLHRSALFIHTVPLSFSHAMYACVRLWSSA